MKQVFYLKDDPEFINLIEDEYESIIWLFRWNGHSAYATDLRELIETFYTEN
jgi:hypothetical protein